MAMFKNPLECKLFVKSSSVQSQNDGVQILLECKLFILPPMAKLLIALSRLNLKSENVTFTGNAMQPRFPMSLPVLRCAERLGISTRPGAQSVWLTEARAIARSLFHALGFPLCDERLSSASQIS